VRGLAAEEVREALLADYLASGARGRPRCLAEVLASLPVAAPLRGGVQRAERQGRHLGQMAGHKEEIQKAAAAA